MTAYNILIDLFDIGWQQKLTALYNLTRQSVDKIVEPLTLENGIDLKLNRKTKIPVLIDWSVSAGLLGNK